MWRTRSLESKKRLVPFMCISYDSKAETLLCWLRSIYSRLWFFLWSCMDVRVGLWRRLSAEEWCFWSVVLEKTLESPLDWRESKPVNPIGNQPWIFIGRTDAEAPRLWRPDMKSRLTEKDLMLGKIEGRRRRDDRGWDGWMASSPQWTWVWANSRRWWRTGKPGMLQSMGLQRVRHDWVTELN